ncbi:putative Ca2+/H+ antiporter (TMEM165/GDT1 family) [Pseudofulvimonas gallinarii]|jgi:putative Ca2+/H+ antiporter (TMEM165/GDT1 family)|uniref:GDT1 family protein n=2 Tax=Pseudofulvimonas gallinarii TaxID=634155 RepID=A0A4R3LKM3_9GAMM|nr:putative Ca2+/H+ antiporter (TMEM165/GDT1 family) [Pseudofulvimonas gallinarii]
MAPGPAAFVVFVRLPVGIIVTMSTFLLATGLVALAEIGDKTQLLSLLLAARYRRPWTIVLGILVATLANHALAAWLGALLADAVSPEVLRWIVVAGFAAMGLWALKPDTLEADSVPQSSPFGVFGITLVAFFLAEIGDKTQVATIALASRHATELSAVVLGTTAGMMIANVPAVFAGAWLLRKLPMVWIRRAAAASFLALAILAALAPVHAPASHPTPATGTPP